jgi:beta-lactamase regulating signal transducer with metallopeptidase domain
MNALIHLYPGDRLALVALSVLQQATVVILTAWLAARLCFRRHAAARHGLWLAALILVLLSPATAIVMEAANVRIVAISLPEFLTADEAPADVAPVPSNSRGALNSAMLTSEVLPLTPSSGQPPIGDWSGEHDRRIPPAFASAEASPSAASSSAGQVLATSPAVAEAPVPTPSVPRISIAARLRAVAGAVFAIWLAGVIYGFARLGRSGIAIRRLVRMSRPGDTDERLRPILWQIERHLGMKRMPPVLLWRDRKLQITPLTIGIFRPVVMLSKSLLQSLSSEELREVLVHECAHVLRRDAAIGLLQRIALVLFWPYPLVLLLNRHLTIAREEVCDNYVLLHSTGPQYAQTLFDLSERIHPLSPNLAPVGLFQHHCPLEKRVAGLLDLRRNVMTKINRWAALSMSMVFLTIALGAASAKIVSAKPGAKPAIIHLSNNGDDQERTPAAADEFAKKLQSIEKQELADVGREGKIAAYETLLRDYPDHPNRAKAMMAIAALWQITDPSLQIKPDEEKGIAWLRRAREAAARGSEDWIEAQSWLAARIRPSDVSEARRLLEEILDTKPGPIAETQTLYELQGVACEEGKLDEAEKICTRLQEWPNDPARMPEKMFDKGQVYRNIQTSASIMMNTWNSSMQPPPGGRVKKIADFVKKYPTDFNQREAERVLHLPMGMWGSIVDTDGEKTGAQPSAQTPREKNDQVPALERRTVNKLVKDFPEKTDLSTPESALAAMLHSCARKNIRAIEELSWTDWPKQLGVDLKEIEESLRNDPNVPSDFSKMILESEILQVFTYRDDLAEVIVKSNVPEDGPYKACFVGKINGTWKIMTFIENTSPSIADFQTYFESNKERQWSLFRQVKEDVGDNRDGKSVVALRVLPLDEKKTAPGNKKNEAQEAAAIQRRAVNKLVKDFPEKTDLSTPESALAAYFRATAKKDAKAVLALYGKKSGPAEIDELERFWKSDPPEEMAIFLQSLLDAEIIEVDTYRNDYADVIAKLKFPDGWGKDPYSARSFGKFNGEWKSLGEDRLPSLEAARANFDRKKTYLWDEYVEARDVAAGKTPPAKRGKEIKLPPDKYDAVKATTPDAERLLLMGLVENFFNHNAHDITARKTLEWGEVKKNADGSRSIRYKFEARIWDKETMIADQIFTFDKDNVMLSYKDADGTPVKKEPKKVDLETKEGLMALVEDFFANNFRDVTARETLEWGDIEKDKDGNTSIRYKYVATIWGKDQQIMNQVFTFDKKGEFVRYRNLEGFPQKMEKKEDKPQLPAADKSV